MRNIHSDNGMLEKNIFGFSKVFHDRVCHFSGMLLMGAGAQTAGGSPSGGAPNTSIPVFLYYFTT